MLFVPLTTWEAFLLLDHVFLRCIVKLWKHLPLSDLVVRAIFQAREGPPQCQIDLAGHQWQCLVADLRPHYKHTYFSSQNHCRSFVMERSSSGSSRPHSLFLSSDSSHSLRSLRAHNAENNQHVTGQSDKRKTLRKYRSMYPLRKISNTHINESRLSLRSFSGQVRSDAPNGTEAFTMASPAYRGPGSGSGSLLTPPSSDEDSFSTAAAKRDQSSLKAFPFPLQPASLFSARENMQPQTPDRRCFSARNRKETTSRLDRFISNSSSPSSPQSPAETFRLSKDVGQMTPEEKARRHQSGTPDPFGPLKVSRLRADHFGSAAASPETRRRSFSRTLGFATVSELATDVSAFQDRDGDLGAMEAFGAPARYNGASASRGVPNGHGGYLNSGSNAPMYESKFLDDLSTDQDVDQMEQRLAVAFDVDRNARILENSKPYADTRCVSTGSIGVKRKRLYLEHKTTWKDGQWTQEGQTEGTGSI